MFTHLRTATLSLALLAFGAATASAQDAMAHKDAMTDHAMAEHTMKKDAMHTDHAMAPKDAMAPKAAMTKDAMTAEAEVTTVDLTQTPGAFTTEHLDLAPGQYRFRVTNASVDHEVGFFIQRAADKDGAPGETALENSFTQSAIALGQTSETGVVTLAPGEYVYSCPLNPTPHYTISVK